MIFDHSKLHIDKILRDERKYQPHSGWRRKIYNVIYHADTPQGKFFDVALLVIILLSCVIVMLHTIPIYFIKYGDLFYRLEWIISIFFSIEYLLRVITIKNKKAYIFSFMGIVDFLAIVPFFLSIIFPTTEYFLMIRMLRLMRVFRVFNLLDYLNDGTFLLAAMRQGSRKIYIFLLFIIIFTVLVGSLMYVVEGGKNGFDSIPQSIYWAVVTLTTVGYGDISPVTPLGKFLSVILMLCGYSIIAVPTGILTSEMRNFKSKIVGECTRCGSNDNDSDARYCKLCGEKIIH